MRDGQMMSLAMREPDTICAVSGTINENLNDIDGQPAYTHSSHLCRPQ